jgi:hypothetical protein
MIVKGRDRDYSASFGDEDEFENDSKDEYYENILIPNSSLDAEDNEDPDDTASAAPDMTALTVITAISKKKRKTKIGRKQKQKMQGAQIYVPLTTTPEGKRTEKLFNYNAMHDVYVEIGTTKQDVIETRLLIELFYIHTLGVTHPDDWREMNTILSIVTSLELKIDECQKVECIITQAHKCLQEGKKYNGTIN